MSSTRPTSAGARVRCASSRSPWRRGAAASLLPRCWPRGSRDGWRTAARSSPPRCPARCRSSRRCARRPTPALGCARRVGRGRAAHRWRAPRRLESHQHPRRGRWRRRHRDRPRPGSAPRRAARRPCAPAESPPAAALGARARSRRASHRSDGAGGVPRGLRARGRTAMRVLIVLPGALGDVVRALPLLGRLRRAWPQAWIAWAVEPLSAPLLAGHPWLDETLVFSRNRGLRAFLPFLVRVRRGRFDVALDLGRGAKSALIARASGAPERLGFGRRDGREGGWLLATRRLPPQAPARPKLEHFLAFGDALGLPPVPVAFGLAPTPAEAEEAAALTAALPRPLVAACVGSSCPSRLWFPERTAALLDQLGTGAVLLGTAADAAFAAA